LPQNTETEIIKTKQTNHGMQPAKAIGSTMLELETSLP